MPQIDTYFLCNCIRLTQRTIVGIRKLALLYIATCKKVVHYCLLLIVNNCLTYNIAICYEKIIKLIIKKTYKYLVVNVSRFFMMSHSGNPQQRSLQDFFFGFSRRCSRRLQHSLRTWKITKKKRQLSGIKLETTIK